MIAKMCNKVDSFGVIETDICRKDSVYSDDSQKTTDDKCSY